MMLEHRMGERRKLIDGFLIYDREERDEDLNDSINDSAVEEKLDIGG
jgi:hypothetical protein